MVEKKDSEGVDSQASLLKEQASTQGSEKTLEESIMTQSTDTEAEQLDVFNVIAEELDIIDCKWTDTFRCKN